MSERTCKYCQCSNEPDNPVITVNQEDICETCIHIAAEVAREMGALGRE